MTQDDMLAVLMWELRHNHKYDRTVNVMDVAHAMVEFEDEPERRIRAIAGKAANVFFEEMRDEWSNPHKEV